MNIMEKSLSNIVLESPVQLCAKDIVLLLTKQSSAAQFYSNLARGALGCLKSLKIGNGSLHGNMALLKPDL